jgi:hypothetical protein
MLFLCNSSITTSLTIDLALSCAQENSNLASSQNFGTTKECGGGNNLGYGGGDDPGYGDGNNHGCGGGLNLG